jgi:hypothetical protein
MDEPTRATEPENASAPDQGELSPEELQGVAGGTEGTVSAILPDEPMLLQETVMQQENREYTAISNIMKTKHETVKNSISNVR